MTETQLSGGPGTTRANRLAFGAVAFTVAAWASAFVAIRDLGDDFGPGPLTLGRLVVAAVVLSALLAVRREWVRPTRREWTLVGVYGVVWFGVYNVALNAAEQRVDAGTAAMLVNIGPILIALLAGTLLREGYPRWLLVGAGVAFAGAALIGVATAGEDDADLLGIAFGVGAAVAYAIGVVAQKPVLRRLPSLQVTWLGCMVAAVACLPYAPALVEESGRASAGTLGWLFYLGLVPTALAFSTWGYALARMDAGRLGVTTYLVPPLAIVLAWILLAEAPAPLALAGGAVCLAGVALSRRR
ncbi:DMT family transporter [Actinocorallia populi]|uniref:DMT family transporter n=1 Tax=Actinocorallia populi TaxID=2079200 RepID=UPI000D08A55A|nr:DMT family transporter [Actinocorallia populi]